MRSKFSDFVFIYLFKNKRNIRLQMLTLQIEAVARTQFQHNKNED